MRCLRFETILYFSQSYARDLRTVSKLGVMHHCIQETRRWKWNIQIYSVLIWDDRKYNVVWNVLKQIYIFVTEGSNLASKQFLPSLLLSQSLPNMACSKGYFLDPFCLSWYRHTVKGHSVHCYIVLGIQVNCLISLQSKHVKFNILHFAKIFHEINA
jgi:hypothetical protein